MFALAFLHGEKNSRHEAGFARSSLGSRTRFAVGSPRGKDTKVGKASGHQVKLLKDPRSRNSKP